jgi:hypothetical protein
MTEFRPTHETDDRRRGPGDEGDCRHDFDRPRRAPDGRDCSHEWDRGWRGADDRD